MISFENIHINDVIEQVTFRSIYVYAHICIHAITINEKEETMNLKEGEEGFMEEFGGRNETVYQKRTDTGKKNCK